MSCLSCSLLSTTQSATTLPIQADSKPELALFLFAFALFVFKLQTHKPVEMRREKMRMCWCNDLAAALVVVDDDGFVAQLPQIKL